MTSKLTRERLQEIAEDGFLKHGESKELARMALAAMDSEPDCKERKLFCSTDTTRMRKTISVSAGTEDAPLYRHAQPAPVVPVVPDEIKHRIGGLDWGWEGEFNRGWNACRAAMLAAAPQSPGSEPATVPGKLIPVSEQKPDCWCLTCRPVVLNDMRFVVCPDCGNKRCPRANDHRNACTGSNRPGQEGSAYPAAPQEDINALIPLVSRNEQEVK